MERLSMSEGDKAKVELIDGSTVKGEISRVFVNKNRIQGARIQLDNKHDAYGTVISGFVGPKDLVGEKIVEVK
jgi:hypothetical protein